MTLLAAPAGWGKTTLVDEWAARTELPVAWVRLEESDGLPLRFWRRVVAALGRLHPGIAGDALALLGASQPPPLAHVVEAALDVAAALPWDAALVLDDLHQIEAPEVFQGLGRFLDAMPSTIHVIVATRHDPPLRLSRLRAQRELVEIRAADLRFDVAEAARFVAAIPGLDLGPNEVATLVERTEGWITGLWLAALSLQDRGDVGDVIAGFGGTQRDVADYLGDEVLARQPEPVTNFLLQTSVLDRLTASLCDAVTGRGDGRPMLEYLEQHHLFLLPLDDHRRWYRYHGLFAELLRSRLRQTAPEQEATFHRRAAAWYEAQGLPLDAVHHAFLAGAMIEAAGVLERAADRLLWSSGEVTALLRWVEALPGAVREARPRLLRSHAWSLVLAGRLAEAEDAVTAIEQRLATGSPAENDAPEEPDGLAVLQGEVAAIRSRIAAASGDQEGAARFAQESLSLVPGSHGRLRSDVAINLGYANLVLGRLREAAAAFDEAIAMGWASGNVRAALFGCYYLAQVRLTEGRLREARSLLADELERLERGGHDAGTAISILRSGLGEVLYEQNELAAACRQLERAVDEGQRGGDAKTLIYAYLALTRVYQALGDDERATATLRRKLRLSSGGVAWLEQARLALSQGDVQAAARWAAESGFDAAGDFIPGDEGHALTLARLLVAQGRWDEAVALLDRLLTAADAGGRGGRVVEVLALLALARHGAGDRAAAIALLNRALALAAPEGYLRTFVDLGPPMADLLRDLLLAGRRADDPAASLAYAQSLLRAFPESGNGRTGVIAAPGLVEPLTEREFAILELVAAGRSNQEIAAELYVALGTVKAHLNHIYGKLVARNRTEAIASARRLGVLPGSERS